MSRYVPDIPVKFEGKFPDDYVNTMQYWGFFSKEEIEQNKGKLLMLDIDFGRYCSLACPYCFRKSNVVDDFKIGDLSYDELLEKIDDAKELGLKSIKICGAGEPTQHVLFLQFVRDMTEKGIGIATFTKGHVLGSDVESARFNKKHGINSAKELCEELSKLKVSFMLAFQSFDSEIQNSMVGNIKDYTQVRNQALKNLVDAGFTNSNPTRLALCSNPITKQNYGEIFDIYVYARKRNIYPVTATLMVSGKQIDSKFLQEYDVSAEQKISLWEKIYEWNIENGVQSIENLKSEGISVLPGIHPCNQVACGLYLTRKGAVVGCPGFTDIIGSVKEESITAIWKRSENRKLRAGKFNCRCPPKDGITIPSNLYDEVLNRLEAKQLKRGWEYGIKTKSAVC